MIRLLYILLAVVVLQGCKGTGNLTTANLSAQYKRELTTLNPEYMVYHHSDTLSKVYFRVNNSELTYALMKEDQPREAALRFHYKVYESYESGEILDSASVILDGFQREWHEQTVPGQIRHFRESGQAEKQGGWYIVPGRIDRSLWGLPLMFVAIMLFLYLFGQLA